LNIDSCHPGTLAAYGGAGVAIIADGKTLKLELKPEIEAGLMAKAHARGLSLETYLEEVLKSAAATKPRPASRKSLAQ
jgi:hypothetical protein